MVEISVTELTSGKHCDNYVGPVVDDLEPYSAIGIVNLKLLYDHLSTSSNILFQPIPDAIVGHTHLKYGFCNHDSPAFRILGSVMISATFDGGSSVSTRQLLLEGFSKWVIGNSVTINSNIILIKINALQFFLDEHADHFSLIKHGLLRYIPMAVFGRNKNLCDQSVLSCLNANLPQ